MPNCSVMWCKNRTDVQTKSQNHISYHRFPKDPAVKQVWVKATGSPPEWAPTAQSTICSVHFEKRLFVERKNCIRTYLEKSAVPTLNLPDYVIINGNISTTTSQNSEIKEEDQPSDDNKFQEGDDDDDDDDNTMGKIELEMKAVMKKWANLCDSLRKCEERKISKLFHEELEFLQKNLQLCEKNGSTDDVSDDASDSLGSDNRPAKRRNTNKQKKGSLNLIKAADEDIHVSFIKGLLPSLNKLGEDETLQFQMGVIKLLRDIKKEMKIENDPVPYCNLPYSFKITVV